MKRRCIEPDCPQLTTRTRCPTHQQTHMLNRGYDSTYKQAHREARRELAPQVAPGTYPCTRCGQPIDPTTAWDADRRPDGYSAAHASCNRSAGALGIP